MEGLDLETGMLLSQEGRCSVSSSGSYKFQKMALRVFKLTSDSKVRS